MSGRMNWSRANAQARERRHARESGDYRPRGYTRTAKEPVETTPSDGVWREITAKFRSICGLCGAACQPGDRVWWQKGRRNVRHPACHLAKERRGR